MQRETYRRPGLARIVGLVANLVVRHPAYLFSAVTSLYLRYESARLRVLQHKGVKPVLCMGTFYMNLDSTDPNAGVSSNILLRGGLYEPGFTEVFRQLLSRGDTVLDIGANIGWYSLLAAEAVGPSGRVIACEPEPHNFELLESSARLNRLTNVTLLKTCISDRNGEQILHLSTTNAGGHTIMQATGSGGEVRAQSVTIDTLCDRLSLKQIDVVKIDAESAEPLILQGAKGLLSRGQPRFILMEFSPPIWQEYRGLLLRLFHEFDVFEVRSWALRRLDPSGLPRHKQANLFMARKAPTPIVEAI